MKKYWFYVITFVLGLIFTYIAVTRQGDKTWVVPMIAIPLIICLFTAITLYQNNRYLERLKLTLVPSIDFIPYIQAKASNMCEGYFLCFRFNLYYPLIKEKSRVTDNIYDT